MSATAPDELGAFAMLNINIEARLDERWIPMREVIAFKPGSLLKLQRSAGEHVDVLVGGAVLGYGEVVVIENVLGVRITDLYEEQ